MKKNTLIAVIALVALAAVVLTVALLTRETGTPGDKKITVTVVADGESKVFSLETDEEFLRGALDEKQLIKGEESAYGLFVTEVDGIAADVAAQEWWCLTKGGEPVMTGVSETPIADGDSFELTLTVGY